jgi:phospholipid transport system substrate-binding protein
MKAIAMSGLSARSNLARMSVTLTLMFWLFGVSAGALEEEWRQAEVVVQETSDSMLVLIEEARSYADEDPERFYTAVEALLSPVVDFPRFAGSVMGKKYYQQASKEQRERFADSFKWGLVRTYGLALTEFNDGELKLVPATNPPRRPDRVSVNQEIHSAAGQIYPVVYSMALSKDGVWRMRNIIVNGVNMGLTYRSQFQSAAQDPAYAGDLDKIIDAWADLLAAEADKVIEETKIEGTSTSQ